MKQILDGNVIHILSIPNGLVAAVLEEVTQDGKMMVEYRLIYTETEEIQRVSNSIYLLSKFGAGHKGVELQVSNHLMCRSCMLNDGRVFVIESGGNCKLLDADGYSKWKGIVTFEDEAPNDAAFDGKFLWLCYPEHNTVVRYNSDNITQNLRIGSEKAGSNFKKPCGLFYQDGVLYISNRDSHSVWAVDTSTYAAEELHEFSEPCYQYVRVQNDEIVRLNSGVYII